MANQAKAALEQKPSSLPADRGYFKGEISSHQEAGSTVTAAKTHISEANRSRFGKQISATWLRRTSTFVLTGES